MKWIKEYEPPKVFVDEYLVICNSSGKYEAIKIENWVNSQFVEVNKLGMEEMLANYYSYGDLVKEGVGELEQANKAFAEDEEKLQSEEKERLRSLLRELREKEVKDEAL